MMSAAALPSYFRERALTAEGVLVLAFVGLIIIFSLASPVFLTVGNLENIGRQTALVTIIAVGMAFVIISGEFDLSVGSTVALAGVAAAIAMREVGAHWAIGGVAGLLTGAAVGFVNGYLTIRLRIPSFLITLGSLSIARGIVLLITETRPVIISNRTFYAVFGEGHLFGVPAPIAWTVVVVLAGIVGLHFSAFGRAVYASGGNPVAARYSGIPVDRVKTLSLILAGLLAGLAGLILSARAHAARPDVGAGLELDVITAVILGGAALGGGKGTIVGALIGSLIIGILNNGLVLIGVDPSLQIVIKGLIIWISVSASRL
jgi:ribose transport system permease protein